MKITEKRRTNLIRVKQALAVKYQRLANQAGGSGTKRRGGRLGTKRTHYLNKAKKYQTQTRKLCDGHLSWPLGRYALLGDL